jgi:AmmeMemoRadiSam system radical SAM enzyme/AmmeMemoRadiSam system protein B/AmmeMemoRadiSam system protein A
MARTIFSPPQEHAGADGIKAGGWWHETDDGRRLVCDLCPRGCSLGEGDRGFCFVRQNLAGRMVSTTYGRSTGFCIDPIEKKPLNQFYPGSSVLSFGTAGCNLGCKFCQNWSTSKSRQVDQAGEAANPETIAEAAKELKCRSVAFTYNDPIIWAEYAIDTAKACRAVGVKTVAVTSGYLNAAARGPFYEFMDAANVDLKGFTEDFYWKLTSGHLEPVKDTLRWLARETNVWLEITNLMIPRANDSPDETERMCGWIVEELGPDVPLHFTAFHPDFRMLDREPTPPETLANAYEIARRAGLRYVYTGNLYDRQRQSTYCPGCGRVLIERDGYQLGVYGLLEDRCRHCGTQIAGRFDEGPGDWGARRQPVRIAAYARPKPTQPTEEPRMEAQPVKQPESQSPQSARPALNAEQEERVVQAAGRRVIAAVCGQPAERLDDVLGEISGQPLLGAFVSLKRAGQLRSCCGFLGQSVPMYQALDHAAVRAAKDDPRFPPIAPNELEQLDMEVWLLWGLEPVTAKGEDRAKGLVIGKHGLQIQRGHARGLLLPAVAVEHHLDPVAFLQQTCRKAGLPLDAWKDDQTTLMTFEGYAIHRPLKSCLVARPEPAVPGPTPADVSMLADFCRQNVVAFAFGATPSFYLPNGYDGNVNGLVVTVHLPGTANTVESSQIALQSEMPLQSSLLDLSRAVAGVLQSSRINAQTLQGITVGLTVLWDPALQGTLAKPDLVGLDPRRRAVAVVDRSKWALIHDPKQSPDELLAAAAHLARLPDDCRASVASLAIASTEPRVAVTNVPRPQAGAALRPPAVAGRFYPGTPAEVEKTIDEMLPAEIHPEAWAGALVPHAGWIYSGRLAAAVFSRIKFPPRAIILAPKHNRDGADWAVAPHRTWSLPGGNLESDPELAEQLAKAVVGLELDAAAHAREHAIEVQLPIIARLAPETRVVGITIYGGDLIALQRFADQMAGVLSGLADRPLLIVSSDMNHYADDERTRRVDRLALDAIEALDPGGLLKTVTDRQISMCGVLPAVVAMETLRRLGSLNRCEKVGYTTSAEASGDTQHVVGYAGILFA